MCTPAQPGREIYSVLLYRRNATELLLKKTSRGLELPSVSVACHSRLAHEITAAIEESWNLRTYCLFPVQSETPSGERRNYHVVELSRPVAQTSTNMQWFPVAELSPRYMEDFGAWAALQESLTLLDQYRREERPGAFGRPEWLHTATRWIEGQAALIGLALTGRFQQLNASATFSLMRFETSGAALWFKAVGMPNLREYSITVALKHLLPGFVPIIVGLNPAWHAWLSLEAEGIHPVGSSPLEQWQLVAATLADLQVGSLGHGLHLINAGCRDIRIWSLANQVAPFFEAMASLMDQQPKAWPPRLSRKDLKTLGAQVEEALSVVDHSEAPNSLGHLDLSPGNVVVGENRCVFLDWAEACVGHPFVTFQYLIEHFRRLCPQNRGQETKLLSSYYRKWRCQADSTVLARTAAVMPLVAAFAYAVAGSTWQDRTGASRPATAAHFRSLTRRMKYEAECWQKSRHTWRLPCLS